MRKNIKWKQCFAIKKGKMVELRRGNRIKQKLTKMHN